MTEPLKIDLSSRGNPLQQSTLNGKPPNSSIAKLIEPGTPSHEKIHFFFRKAPMVLAPPDCFKEFRFLGIAFHRLG